MVQYLVRVILLRSRGQSMVEYTLLFAMITLVVVGSLILLGPQLAADYRAIEHSI